MEPKRRMLAWWVFFLFDNGELSGAVWDDAPPIRSPKLTTEQNAEEDGERELTVTSSRAPNAFSNAVLQPDKRRRVVDPDASDNEEHEADKDDLEQEEASAFPQHPIVTGARMKDYQVEGLQQIVGLNRQPIGGIWADVMGLGYYKRTPLLFPSLSTPPCSLSLETIHGNNAFTDTPNNRLRRTSAHESARPFLVSPTAASLRGWRSHVSFDTDISVTLFAASLFYFTEFPFGFIFLPLVLPSFLSLPRLPLPLCGFLDHDRALIRGDQLLVPVVAYAGAGCGATRCRLGQVHGAGHHRHAEPSRHGTTHPQVLSNTRGSGSGSDRHCPAPANSGSQPNLSGSH
ncbi:hypothetical protein C8R45DRAFT_1115058 [Mycena sanguinolenta]|nr:hypothetical protein C8R45DRAFT_1115058 [Mycena sanguinolenta]